jgi:hypothetical protein
MMGGKYFRWSRMAGIAWPSVLFSALACFGVKANGRLAFDRRFCHELTYGVKDDSEVLVVFLFQLAQLFAQVRVGCEHLPEANERAHDLHVNLHRPVAFELESIATRCSVKA